MVHRRVPAEFLGTEEYQAHLAGQVGCPQNAGELEKDGDAGCIVVGAGGCLPANHGVIMRAQEQGSFSRSRQNRLDVARTRSREPDCDPVLNPCFDPDLTQSIQDVVPGLPLRTTTAPARADSVRKRPHVAQHVGFAVGVQAIGEARTRRVAAPQLPAFGACNLFADWGIAA